MTYDNEYKKICRQEIDFLIAASKRNPSEIEALAAKYIPDKLDQTLSKAFYKAFEIILEKGTSIIGSTIIDKEQDSAGEAILKSKITGLFDSAVTFAEGVGMGIIGLGLPDVPIFTAMIFRNIYQKAALYGFGYESEQEKVYMMKLICGALAVGREAEEISQDIDDLAKEMDFGSEVRFMDEELIRAASDALATDMLYIKFVQGIPIVGAVGGLFNVTTMRKINNFAEIKYHKRSLLKSRQESAK